MKLFVYNNGDGDVKVNVAEVLLIKEFETLWDKKRNITKSDKKGEFRSRAYREFKYIYLMIDWQSPYSQYLEQERHETALNDASMNDDEWEDENFRAACRKYQEIQNSSKVGKLLKTALKAVDSIIIYFDTLDLSERDELSGKPIFKAKDVIGEIQQCGKVIDGIKDLERAFKKELDEESTTWGSQEPGAFD